MSSSDKLRSIAGWTAVGVSTFIVCIWSFWGAIESFHEGWYSPSFWENVLIMLIQYLSFPIVFTLASLAALQLPRLGGALFAVLAVFMAWFFRGGSFAVIGVMLVIPALVLAVLYWFGRPRPKRLAYAVMLIPPLIIMVAFGTPNAVRVASRVNDGDFGVRHVSGNGVELLWAPEGPGWPQRGVSWHEAMEICSYLSPDGTKIEETPQNIWRLPSVEEAVRSQCRHGENAGGVWDQESKKATYRVMPDKETPLWNVHSMTIYMWTSTEVDAERAYIIAYDGNVWERHKTSHPTYLSFRAVRDP